MHIVVIPPLNKYHIHIAFKESFAASGAVKTASPEMQKLIAGGLAEMPAGGKDDVNARMTDLVKRVMDKTSQELM
jgi:hypothetical protein